MWGATTCTVQGREQTDISIHAPRVGSDYRGHGAFRIGEHFNPRSPCGERRCRSGQPDRLVAISIHAPRVGSDGNPVFFCQFPVDFNPRSPCGERQLYTSPFIWVKAISIHAPRVGSDSTIPTASGCPADFNPRSPCGERLRGEPEGPADCHFNPRSPCGERQRPVIPAFSTAAFQSTLPVWGATIAIART